MARVCLGLSLKIDGNPSTATVTLTAPSGGARVELRSSKTAVASVPASVTVPQGATTQTFTVTTHAVNKKMSFTISSSFAGVTQSAVLVVSRH